MTSDDLWPQAVTLAVAVCCYYSQCSPQTQAQCPGWPWWPCPPGGSTRSSCSALIGQCPALLASHWSDPDHVTSILASHWSLDSQSSGPASCLQRRYYDQRCYSGQRRY